jgi:hypothetical protein
MSAFRPFDPFLVFFDLAGNLAAGGTLHFYEAGTTTDADVYGDNDLSTNNGATIDIGTDGRAVDDIWCDGSVSYRCRVYASDDTLIADRDDISMPGASSSTIPTLVSGDFLTNDGSTMSWAAIRQALDPSGASNKLIGSDGTNLVWVDKPADGTSGDAGTNADVTVTSSSVKWSDGSGDQFFIQTGTGSAAASGGHTASATVTFGTAFKALAAVFVIPTSKTFASAGYQVANSITSKSTSGFDVYFDTNSSDGSNGNIISAIPFDYVAFGTIAAS